MALIKSVDTTTGKKVSFQNTYVCDWCRKQLERRIVKGNQVKCMRCGNFLPTEFMGGKK